MLIVKYIFNAYYWITKQRMLGIHLLLLKHHTTLITTAPAACTHKGTDQRSYRL